MSFYERFRPLNLSQSPTMMTLYVVIHSFIIIICRSSSAMTFLNRKRTTFSLWMLAITSSITTPVTAFALSTQTTPACQQQRLSTKLVHARRTSTKQHHTTTITNDKSTTTLYNLYDDWSLDLLSSSQSQYTYDDLIMPLDEENIEHCLEELMDSEYGETMFGRHDLAADVG